MREMFVLILISTIFSIGCARFKTLDHSSLDYRTVSSDAVSNTARAEKLYRKSLGFIDSEGYEFAEHYLQKALIADVNYGPAHNALGKVYYAKKEYYLAAWEFQHAIGTLPSRAEPLNNLGLVFEAVEQFDEAISKYSQATILEPNSSEYLGNLIRARIRNGESAASIGPEIESLLLIESRPDWCDWARTLLALDQYRLGVEGVIIEEEFCETENFIETDPPVPGTLSPLGENLNGSIFEAPGGGELKFLGTAEQ